MISTYFSSFAAGLLTFFTPCVLPMIPLYLAFLTGAKVSELANPGKKMELLRLVVPFVIGFTIVFTLMGASASILGKMFYEYHRMIQKIAAVVVFVFALHFLKLLPQIKFMQMDTRLLGRVTSGGSIPSAFLFGVAFALGWSPCVGPILGGILALAAVGETVMRGIALLLIYSIGFAIPFIAVSLLAEQLLPLLKKVSRFIPKIETICGLILFEMALMLYRG